GAVHRDGHRRSLARGRRVRGGGQTTCAHVRDEPYEGRSDRLAVGDAGDAALDVSSGQADEIPALSPRCANRAGEASNSPARFCSWLSTIHVVLTGRVRVVSVQSKRTLNVE